MTLEELQAKYEAVLLCAPALAADMADMVQDERANERNECVTSLIGVANEYAHECNDEYYTGYKQGVVNGIDAIRNRNEKEVG